MVRKLEKTYDNASDLINAKRQRHQDKINGKDKVISEFQDLVNTENYEEAFQLIYDTYVPSSGKAKNMAGELCRAMMKILYRDWNDGDLFYTGYGYKTCGEAVSFIAQHTPDKIARMFERIQNKELEEDEYTNALNEIRDELVKFIADNLDLFNEPAVDYLDTEVSYEETTYTFDAECWSDFVTDHGDFPSWVDELIRYGNFGDAYVNSQTRDWVEINGLNQEGYEELENNFSDWVNEYEEELRNELGDEYNDEEEDEEDW